MKKILIITFSILIISHLSYAQEGFGLTGGVNLSTLKFSTSGASVTPDRAAKFAIGLNNTSQLGGKMYLRIGLLYDQRGYKPEDGSGVDKISLNYISLPLMLQYWGSESFNIHAGFEVSYLMGGNEVDGVNTAEGLKKFDISLGVGAEYLIAEQFGLGFRYLPGLTNLVEDDGGTGIKIKNDNIRIYAIVKF